MESYCHDHLEKNEAVSIICNKRRTYKPTFFLLVRDKVWEHYKTRKGSYTALNFQEFKRLLSQVFDKKLIEKKFKHTTGIYRNTPIITGVKFKDLRTSMNTRAGSDCVADGIHETEPLLQPEVK